MWWKVSALAAPPAKVAKVTQVIAAKLFIDFLQFSWTVARLSLGDESYKCIRCAKGRLVSIKPIFAGVLPFLG